MYKVIVFIPENHKESLKKAMFAAGGGKIGAYDCCSFETKGMGQFRPSDGAKPYIGNKNQLEYVEEYRVEMVVQDGKISDVLRAMKESHPYEEPAYDVFKHESIDF